MDWCQSSNPPFGWRVVLLMIRSTLGAQVFLWQGKPRVDRAAKPVEKA